MAGLIDLITSGQEELEQDRLEDAEKTFSKALEKCSTDDDRQEVLRCLLKLAGKYLRLKQSDKPKVLFDFLEKTDLQERTRVMEWLARVHQQTEDLPGAERIYTEIFELRARNWGPEHPDAVGALKTAALFRQMQGKSAEDLYVRAYNVSKEVSQKGLVSKPKFSVPVVKPSLDALLPDTSIVLDDLLRAPAPTAVPTTSDSSAAPTAEAAPQGVAPEAARQVAPAPLPPRQTERIDHLDLDANHAQIHGANAGSASKESAFNAAQNAQDAALSQDTSEPARPANLDDMDTMVLEARKKGSSKKSTLYLLDELLINEARAELAKESEAPAEEEAPDFTETPLTLKASLQEMLAVWEPFCNMITKQLVKLLQQSSNPAYRKTLTKLTELLTETTPKTLDMDHPFIACQRRPACNYLDWAIVKELAPVYAAYDGTWGTYPFEIGMIYACLRRAFELGPLHVDTLQSLYRLAHIYTNEMFGCYDLEFAAAAFRVCALAFREHPEIDELTRVRCRTNLASVLMSKNELNEAKDTLKDAIKLTDGLQEVSQSEMLSILKILADCTNKLGDYDTTAGVYERIRNFQEAMARDSGLFETLIHLIHNYAKAGNMGQVQAYLQRIQWELDWFEDPNPMREAIAAKAEELEEYYLAEQMLNAIMAQTKPTEVIAGRAATSLIRLYEKTGRNDLAARMRGGR